MGVGSLGGLGQGLLGLERFAREVARNWTDAQVTVYGGYSRRGIKGMDDLLVVGCLMGWFLVMFSGLSLLRSYT